VCPRVHSCSGFESSASKFCCLVLCVRSVNRPSGSHFCFTDLLADFLVPVSRVGFCCGWFTRSRFCHHHCAKIFRLPFIFLIVCALCSGLAVCARSSSRFQQSARCIFRFVGFNLHRSLLDLRAAQSFCLDFPSSVELTAQTCKEFHS
jgi:hypothetical protein